MSKVKKEDVEKMRTHGVLDTTAKELGIEWPDSGMKVVSKREFLASRIPSNGDSPTPTSSETEDDVADEVVAESAEPKADATPVNEPEVPPTKAPIFTQGDRAYAIFKAKANVASKDADKATGGKVSIIREFEKDDGTNMIYYRTVCGHTRTISRQTSNIRRDSGEISLPLFCVECERPLLEAMCELDGCPTLQTRCAHCNDLIWSKEARYTAYLRSELEAVVAEGKDPKSIKWETTCNRCKKSEKVFRKFSKDLYAQENAEKDSRTRSNLRAESNKLLVAKALEFNLSVEQVYYLVGRRVASMYERELKKGGERS